MSVFKYGIHLIIFLSILCLLMDNAQFFYIIVKNVVFIYVFIIEFIY